MNISRRLEKIEEKLSLTNPESDFCDCWEKHWRSSLESVYNQNPEIEIEIHPEPDFEKGYCDRCRKAIAKKDIEIHKTFEEI